KLDQNNQLVVVTTNLKTASPLAGVTLQALDYQQTVLAEATSTADGITRLEVPHKPFLVVAKLGNDSNYLRLDDGESLSISHFDTGGQKLKKGLKGFIYGERGVWRPGDPIYLTFVLFDPTDQLPTNHPVHFQLTNSRGQTIQRETRTSSVGGFYHIATKTPADAPTGNYTATFFVGGTRYDKVLKIETVVPNRLKVNLVPEEELVTAPNMKLKAKLESQWLHGAPAENLQVDISSKLRSATTRFSKFSEFVFDDPTRRYQSEREAIYSGKLDQDGNLDLEAKLDVSGNPSGMLRADILTKVYEPSGAFSQAAQSVKVSPYAHYVGLRVPKGDKARGMLLTDMNHAVEVVRVDGDGNLSGTGKVQMHLYKMRWRSWWQKGQESLADFVSSNHYQSVQKGTVDLVDGKATWNFQVNYPAWGRYLVTAVDADGKHRSAKVVYIDWPGWAGKQRKDNPGGASVLTLSADEASYDVGQPVTLTMPTSPGARMLVSIETGSRILESKWIESQGERTQYTLNATPDMAPTAYAHVTLIQGHASSQNDAPIRMYGITPIKVVDSTTKLDPILEAPESFEPNSTGKISVRERSGKAMTYTLAVVDEGLLGLTSFKTPNPWDTMYRREALGVKTWDLYDDVAGAFGGKLNKLLSIGGSDEEKEPENKRANRFKPMVEFLGPFTLAAGETRDHAIKIPQYVGAVRAMVVAADTNQGSFGSGEREIFVRKPLMVLATLPRVLGPLEQVKLPISVFAMTPEMRNVSVEVKTEGPLTVRGERKRSLTFTRPGDDIVSFPLEVSQSTGIGVVEITARGHGQTAQHRIEIDVRHANQPVSQLFTAMVEPKANWEAALTMPGMPNTNTATLEVSHLPPLNLEERLGYLIRYPHGCIEQTTSSVFPQLLLSSLMPLTETQSIDIQKNVTAGIERLKTFQVSDGGFGYWPGQSASAWGTNYAGHFLLEAKALGYALPAGMLEQWTSYQRQEAQSWTNNGRDGDQLIQAYRLYGLALAQQPELSAMNRLKQSGNLRLQTRWRLAAAYHLAGQLDVAKNLILGQSTETQAYAGHGNTYGSALRDQALILDTLALMGMKKEAFSIATQISNALSSKSWYSTQSTAFSLLSMIRFAGQAGTQGLEGSYVIGPQKRQTFSTDMPLFSTKLPLPELKRVKMSVTTPSTAPHFVRVLTRGVPKLGKETPASRGLALSVKYTDTEGAPVDVSAMSQGTDFQATITVTNKTLQGRVKDIALSQVVPSGWEIHNERLVSSSPVAKTHFDYQDIRDDRVYTYFDLARGETKTFNIKLNASYEGKFYMPQISVEAMYDGSIYARDYGNWVEVVKPGSEG
ncbi:MAG: MG2 domain-containing protein, partial [Myxococcota bacterium]|nr:MG2 domain-containing protein [Myxococcota bacterium]